VKEYDFTKLNKAVIIVNTHKESLLYKGNHSKFVQTFKNEMISLLSFLFLIPATPIAVSGANVFG
jgi:hypothetical protein